MTVLLTIEILGLAALLACCVDCQRNGAATNATRRGSETNRPEPNQHRADPIPAEQGGGPAARRLEDTLGPLEVDAAPVHVLGFPLNVAITVGARNPSASLKRLPLAGAESLNGVEITIVRRGAGGAPFVHKPADPLVDEQSGAVSFSLRPGERRRMLLEVSELLPASTTPGTYELRLSYRAEWGSSTKGPPKSIDFRAPGAREKAELDRRRPELERAGAWDAWTLSPLERSSGPPSSTQEPSLLFYELWRYLRDPRTRLMSVDLKLVDALAPLYAPEAALLKAELLAARGDRRAYERQLEQVRRRYPGMRWWLEAMANGTSELRVRHPGEAWVR